MDLQRFGQQLQTLRKQARLSQEGLVEALDQRARSGPVAEYRTIDSTLISRWERARPQAGRQWKPTRPYVLHLIHIFAQHLALTTAQAWAAQAGYQIAAAELADLFPPVTPAAPVMPISAHPMPASAPPGHNLPVALTSFVGREAEITLLTESLLTSTTRLLTIVGEGGIGKTRLALAAGQTIYESRSTNQAIKPTSNPKFKIQNRKFPDGVWFVPLAGLEGGANANLANLLATAIAKALTFSFPGAALEPAAQLIDHLRTKALLLILDNFEHLVAGAPFVVELLQQARQISVLVTSRMPLNYQAEQLFWLQGLPILATDRVHAPSIQLFSERTRQQLPGFTLDDRGVQEVVQLCQLVNSNPLAIELAAHWMQHYSLGEMISLLQGQNLTLLQTDQQDVPLRHRAMSAVFETSWQLLSPDQQEALAQSSVFRGAFTREAFFAVTGAALPVLVGLVNSSLLRQTRAVSGCTLYSMHELLRQFAAEKLQLTPLHEQRVQERHAHYYLALAEEIAAQLRGANATPLLDQLDREQDNLSCVLLWSLTKTEQMEIGLRLATALSHYWYQRGHWREGLTWLTRALTQTKSAGVTSARARAWLALGEMLWGQGDYHAARSAYEEALLCFRTLQDQDGIASVVSTLGLVAREQGDAARARVLIEESLANFRNQGNQLAVAWALCSLGEVAVIEEDTRQATALLEESLRLFQQLGDQRGMAWAYNHLGHVAQLCGEYERAMALHETNLTCFRQGDRNGTAWTVNSLASLALDQGDYQGATTHYVESLTLFRELGSKQGIAWCLAGLGSAAAAAGQGVRAARLWGAADALLKTIGARPAPATKQRDQQANAAQRSALGAATFTQAWDEGRTMTLPQAITYALTDLPACMLPPG